MTIDVDWVPDYILEYCLNLLEKRGIKATIFATNESNVLKNVNKGLFEIGLHPSFSGTFNVEDEIRRLKAIFPEAVSLRSHGLYHSSRFLPVFNRTGVKHTSNYLAMLCKDLAPIMQPQGITEYPIYFMDDAYCAMYNREDKFRLPSLKLDLPGLKVFAFHPIHIFLNLDSLQGYEKAKGYRDNLPELKKLVNVNPGVRNLFKDLIKYMSENSIRTYTISQIKNFFDKR